MVESKSIPLGTEIDGTKKGKGIFGMIKHEENMIKDFPEKLIKSLQASWQYHHLHHDAGDDLFNQCQGGKL